jgi:hypothetical protein
MKKKALLDKFEKQYEAEVREYLVLTGDCLKNGVWDEEEFEVRADYLAYVDTATDALHLGDGYLVEPVKKERATAADAAVDSKLFKAGTIYRLRARKFIAESLLESRKDVPLECYKKSYFNRLYPTEVLEEGTACGVLEEVRTQHIQPVEPREPVVVINDEELGELVLDPELEFFRGKAHWLGNEVGVILHVDVNRRASWTKARQAMKKLLAEQERWDATIREFAAAEMTALANDWAEQGDEEGNISETDFARRIAMEGLSMTSDGCFTAYFEDDDMFCGHTIQVEGSFREGLIEAKL